MGTAFAELGARSNFSLLDGASHPEELVGTAAALGLAGLSVCDTNSLAGVVRAHAAAKRAGLRFAVGAGRSRWFRRDPHAMPDRAFAGRHRAYPEALRGR
ncbi:MAG: PHP domain-containing protein, partial [Acetobacteraceae bacterium]|nr:PHP domain-containing protein [Acetobacteraceae bacterium]